jgi:predicted GTPase
MSRLRIAVVLLLLAVPVAILCSLGGYFAWRQGWGIWLWWPLTGCLALAYFLAWRWQRSLRLIGRPDYEVPLFWTERDREAWKLVEAYANRAAQAARSRLGELATYPQTAQELAEEITRFYHPGAADPIGTLTIPEILAVIELASHDLGGLVDQYLPAGHLLTVNNWRQARQAADLYSKASNLYWLVAALFSPVETGLKFAASRMGLTESFRRLQDDLLLWFFTAYIHRVGAYLIDLNSGRLRVGASRYRELVRAQTGESGEGNNQAEVKAAPGVAITVMGQVKAGKSSLINVLLGEQRARTDVLPATNEQTRYELRPPDLETSLFVIDTVGYGHDGPKADQIAATALTARESDLLLLVLHARNPARQADLEMLRGLERWFIDRPERKMPKILAVLTHIDLLSPALEWQPPYNWKEPKRAKDTQIQQAINAVREQFGDRLACAVPACTDPNKTYGVEEWVLPALLALLDEARAVALLRCLRSEAGAEKIQKVMRQLFAAGSQLLSVAARNRFDSRDY